MSVIIALHVICAIIGWELGKVIAKRVRFHYRRWRYFPLSKVQPPPKERH